LNVRATARWQGDLEGLGFAQMVALRCSCSRDRVARMLKMLGRDEVQSLLDEQGMAEVTCEFCNHQYLFDKVDAEQVFVSEVALVSSAAVH
jgi:molecular chaperone Hsp33